MTGQDPIQSRSASCAAPLQRAVSGAVGETVFWTTAARRGWPTAVARSEWMLNPDLLTWAWMKLNCYGFAVDAGARAELRRVEGAVGLAASMAATGDADGARRMMRDWLSDRRAGPRSRRLIRAALPPFLPDVVIDACGGDLPVDHLAAMLQITGDADAARAALRDTIAQGSTDAPFVAANLGLMTALAALNRRLAADGLASVHADGPPTPQALRAEAHLVRRGPVTGPRVSIIVAAWRAASRVGAALASLSAQTYRAIEIIAVDDASGDDTAEVIAQAARRDPRIRLVRLPTNVGSYGARMAGLAVARGDFFTVHDSDDWAHPERIARQIAPLLKSQRLVATTSRWVRIDDEGRFFARQTWPLSRLNPSSPLVRRNVVDAIGGFDTVRVGADSEFLQRMTLAYGEAAIRRMPQLLSVGAHREGSLMTDRAMGARGGAPTPARLAYWQSWRRWHIDEIAQGRRPRLSEDGRAFAAPTALLTSAASTTSS